LSGLTLDRTGLSKTLGGYKSGLNGRATLPMIDNALDFAYSYSNNSVTLTGTNSNKTQNYVLNVPKYINDYPVQKLSGGSGKWNNVTDIKFDTSIASLAIEANCFKYCSTLSKIYIPSTVNYIGANAFYYAGNGNSAIYL
jgi:hypothetical protein